MPYLQSSDRGDYGASLAQSASHCCLSPDVEAEVKHNLSPGACIASAPIDKRPARQTRFSDECGQWRSCFEAQGVEGQSEPSGSRDDH